MNQPLPNTAIERHQSRQLRGLLAGLSYDQLFIDDLCTLAGTLDVRLLPGFAPEPGDLFRIIEGSSLAKISGVFDKVLLPYGNDAWDVNYGDNFVELRFVAVPEPAARTMALAACMAACWALWTARS